VIPLTAAQCRAVVDGVSSRVEACIVLACLTRHFYTTRNELEALTGFSRRRVQLALQALERRGVLQRDWMGAPESPSGRFRLRLTVIQGGSQYCDPGRITVPRSRVDHSSPGATPLSTRTRARPPDPDLTCNRPSVRGEGAGGEPTDGRTESLRQAIQRGWPETLPDAAIAAAIVRLDALKLEARELFAYLRAAHAGHGPEFDGLERARHRFGAATTVKRVQPWIARYRRASGAPRASVREPPVDASVVQRRIAEARRSLDG
jgi:hypothetical protein